MTEATYKVHLPPHPTRMGGVRSLTGIRGVCVHDSEGGELPTSPEALSGFISSPRTEFNLASYHYITDTDSIIIEAPENRIAYSAGGGNIEWVHICIPGKANQTREQWLDTNSRAFIKQCAKFIVDQYRKYGFPLIKLTAAEVLEGRKGYCSHWDISRAYHKSTHTDPGVNFPWDVLDQDIKDLLKPPVVIFDPSKGKYALWPFNPNKKTVGAYYMGDETRYAKGVMRDHVARYFRWFANAPGYEYAYTDAHWIHPITKQNMVTNRKDLFILCTAIAERLDPNWNAFDGDLFDSVVLTQAVLHGLTIEGRSFELKCDGVIGPQMWTLIDSLADGNW